MSAAESTAARKHCYLITDHYNEDRVGTLKISDTRIDPSEKNEETTHHVLNKETKEMHETTVVSCGYVDFESEEAYEESEWSVFQDKLREIDEEHLEAAGLDPEEVFDGEN